MQLWSGTLLSVLASLALSCARSVEEDQGFPRTQTLYVAGFQPYQPSTFNPLDAAPSWPLNLHTGQNLFYEALLSFNSLTGQVQPLLAESWSVDDDGIELSVQPTARFVNGANVTAEDVKFTFDLGARFKGLRSATAWPFLSEIRVLDARRTRFVFNPARKNPLVVLDSLQEIPILPRAVIEPLLEASGN